MFSRSGLLILALLSLALTGSIPALGRQKSDSTDTHLRYEVHAGIQPRFSYGLSEASSERPRQTRMGFGIRRARIMGQVFIGPHLGANVQIAGEGGVIGLLDASLSYRLNDQIRFRIGRMVSAQPRSALLASATRLDAIDRALIAERWTAGTIGSDGRDFGFDVQFQTSEVEVLLFLHNGDGNWSRLRGNYRIGPSAGHATGGIDSKGIAASLFARIRPQRVPGLELGFFGGLNGSRNLNTQRLGDEEGRDYKTYAFHAYWGARPGSQFLRLKLDVISLAYGTTPTNLTPQTTFGYALLGAVRIHRAAEVFGRFEVYDPSQRLPDNGDTTVLAGLSFSPSALRGQPFRQERISLAYSLQTPEQQQAGAAHLVVLQLQLYF